MAREAQASHEAQAVHGAEVTDDPVAPDTTDLARRATQVAPVAQGATDSTRAAMDRAQGAADSARRAADSARGDVLLVPGFTGSKEDYIGVLVPLAGRGWRVASMDLPGQGGFPGLGERGSHTLRSLADSVAAVADWFAPGRRVHLVGHSMGGLVTRELVLSDPERLASWVPMCSGPAAVAASGHTKLLQLEAALAHFPMPLIWEQKEKLDRANGWDPPSQEVADFCARRFIANDPVAMADCAEILMTAPDLTDAAAAALAAADVPATVLTGEHDDEWPIEWQEQMAARLGAPWRIVPGVAHNPATEDPELTAAILDEIFTAAADRPARQHAPE